MTGTDFQADPIPFLSREQAHHWLEHERANLLLAAAQGLAASEERTARLGAALAFSVFWHLHHSGFPSNFSMITRQCLAVGRRLGDRGITANAHNCLGISLAMTNRAEEAVSHIKEQLALCRELTDLHGEQKALGSLAELYFALKRYDQVLIYGEAQWKIASAIGFRSGEHFALIKIGASHHHLGHFDQALTTLDDALHQTRRDGNVYQETSVLEKLGDIHLDRGIPRRPGTITEPRCPVRTRRK